MNISLNCAMMILWIFSWMMMAAIVSCSDTIKMYFEQPKRRDKVVRLPSGTHLHLPTHISISLKFPGETELNEDGTPKLNLATQIALLRVKRRFGAKYGPILAALQHRLKSRLVMWRPSDDHAMLLAMSYKLNCNYIINQIMKDEGIKSEYKKDLKEMIMRQMRVNICRRNGEKLSLFGLCKLTVIHTDDGDENLQVENSGKDVFHMPEDVVEYILRHLGIVYRVVMRLVAKRFATIRHLDI